MIRKFRKLVPHSLVNFGKHFPAAVLANVRYGFPARRLKVIGVTGTDGKTTTVNMIYKILKDAGKKVSMISTINAVIAGKVYDTGFHVTSPDRLMVQKYLRLAADHGDEFMVLEVTSHGLSQFRVWGIRFEVGVITNITHEHLDYHGTFEKYLQAKAKLIKDARYSVLNQDDPSFFKLKGEAKGRVTSFGMHKNTDINLINFPLKLQIPGKFNLYNALAAVAVGRVLGLNEQVIRDSLESFVSLPGRMEEIKNNKGIAVIVDFAHTPNALEQALKTLRSKTKGRLIAVFGAASERDVLKRPKMGEISAKIADVVILTDEDPRFEDRNQIIESIVKGAVKKGARVGTTLFKEPDREKAIQLALKIAEKGDTIGIFGKGHERSMSYQGVERPWSDQEAVKKVLYAG